MPALHKGHTERERAEGRRGGRSPEAVLARKRGRNPRSTRPPTPDLDVQTRPEYALLTQSGVGGHAQIRFYGTVDPRGGALLEK